MDSNQVNNYANVWETSPRDLGRLIVMFALYVYDIGTLSLPELKNLDWYINFVEHHNEAGLLPLITASHRQEIEHFYHDLFMGTISNLVRIDHVINKYLVNWKFERLHAMDKAILRLSVYSLIYRYDIPPEVTIFQANELAEDFSEDKSYKYINGILHSTKEEFRRNFILDYTGKKQDKPLKKKVRLIKKSTGEK